jgi:large subunit ribosomal protein L21
VYAIIRTGGKQYKVSPGDTIRVEKIHGEAGDTIELNDVLFYAEEGNILLGQPTIPKAKVVGEILGQRRAKKVIVFKMKKRKGYSKKQGHRQAFTTLKIKEISVQ